MRFGKKLTPRVGDQHHFFESDVAGMMDILDSQLEGEDVTRFRHPEGQPAVPFPPRPQHPAAVVCRPAHLVSGGVLIFRIARIHNGLSGEGVNFPARHAGLQGRGRALDGLDNRIKCLTNLQRRFGFAVARDVPTSLKIRAVFIS